MNLTPQYICKPGMAYTCVRLLKGILPYSFYCRLSYHIVQVKLNVRKKYALESQNWTCGLLKNSDIHVCIK